VFIAFCVPSPNVFIDPRSFVFLCFWCCVLCAFFLFLFVLARFVTMYRLGVFEAAAIFCFVSDCTQCSCHCSFCHFCCRLYLCMVVSGLIPRIDRRLSRVCLIAVLSVIGVSAPDVFALRSLQPRRLCSPGFALSQPWVCYSGGVLSAHVIVPAPPCVSTSYQRGLDADAFADVRDPTCRCLVMLSDMCSGHVFFQSSGLCIGVLVISYSL